MKRFLVALCMTALAGPLAAQTTPPPTSPPLEVGAVAPDFELPGATAHGVLRDNIKLKYYDAGHMMYLYEPALTELKQNVARFILNPTPATARAAGSN